jgi:CBS domain containing-hemolysin-like protein
MEYSTGIIIVRLLSVVLLVLANGFFVAAEFSLVSVRRTRILELVSQGNQTAKYALRVLENPDKVIAATQLGITLASLGLGWIGEPAFATFLEPLVNLFPTNFQSEVSHSIAAGLSFAIITFLHVVVGELAPKSIALQNSEKTSLFVARPTIWTEWIFKPAIWLLNGTGNSLLRLFGVEPASGHELVHSVEELKMLVTASTEEGVVETDEGEMLHAVFDFGELLVRQVMIPRTEIMGFEADLTLRDSIEIATNSTFTKFPVYDDVLDNIIGVVHIKDLLRAELDPNKKDYLARDLVREAIFIPETVHVRSVLQLFRARRQHIAVVMDEFGGTAGLITLEDLMEEIVGEVSDPFDAIQPEIQIHADGSATIDGLALMDEVNEALGLDLKDPYYDTIAGYFMGKLGRIPKINDELKIKGFRLRVKSMDGMRIERLSFNRLEKPPAKD